MNVMIPLNELNEPIQPDIWDEFLEWCTTTIEIDPIDVDAKHMVLLWAVDPCFPSSMRAQVLLRLGVPEKFALAREHMWQELRDLLVVLPARPVIDYGAEVPKKADALVKAIISKKKVTQDV